jgi:uncharacterized SAM-binding protein YcdF (DUF218 family)
MHSFLSFLASFLFSPLYWIIALLLAGFIFRKAVVKKSCFGFALLLCLVFGNEWLLNSYAKSFQPAPVFFAAGQVFSCGIIAGGFASPDIDGNGIFNSSADRFIQALRLFKSGTISHILINGGNGKKQMKSFREAHWVKNELLIMGVPDSVILIEDESNNTKENALNAKKIFDSLQFSPPYLLISSAHHLPRASLLFKKAGVHTVAYPCNYIAGRGISSIAGIIPSLNVLDTWAIYLKETAGYYWYKKNDE